MVTISCADSWEFEGGGMSEGREDSGAFYSLS